MKTELEKNKEYVDSNHDYLTNLYPDKYIIVVNQQVINSFDSYEQATNYGFENYGIEGKFLIEYLASKPITNFVLNAIL